ncbi:MAG: hypothetical protein WKF35_00125 [Ferruginibacter sp.]
MQKNSKRLHPLRWLAIIILTGTIMVACESKESEKTQTEIMEVKKDSMPVLDTDTTSSTRPEVIKN